MNGILTINKPKDYTSFDVIARLKGMSKTKRIGHSGTLDPMATGVLPIFFGTATKAADLNPYGNDKKEYLAEIIFGRTTDTLDTHGKTLTIAPSNVERSDIQRLIPQFIGDIQQTPPMYSAVRINGQRLYDIARQGIEVEREKRAVTIHEIEITSFDPQAQSGFIRVLCSKGTYIRTLCDDLGRLLGCGAVMGELVRTMSNGFTLDKSYTLEQVQALASDNALEAALLPTEQVLLHLPAIYLSEVQTRMFLNGVRLDLNRIKYKDMDSSYRVYSYDRQFIATATLNRDKMELITEKRFV